MAAHHAISPPDRPGACRFSSSVITYVNLLEQIDDLPMEREGGDEPAACVLFPNKLRFVLHDTAYVIS